MPILIHEQNLQLNLGTPVLNQLISTDNKTSKFLVHIDNTTYVETTYVDYHNKHIVCFSSMAGCPVGCTFCVSGQAQTYRKLYAMGADYEFYATDGTDINAACGQLSYKRANKL